jgi:hypothetical protein
MIRKFAWLGIIAGGLLLSPPAHAAAGDARSAELGYLMVQGRQVLLLTAPSATDLSARAGEIRRRLEAAVSKDGTLQPVAPIRLTDVAGTPVISVGKLPVATVTPRDAARAGQPAWVLANRWAGALETSLGTLRVGNPVPQTLVKLKDAAGADLAFVEDTVAPAAEAGPITLSLKGGRFTAKIEAGVVTLTGQAETLAEKVEVASRVAAVPGVVDVVNQVVVTATRTHTDSELATALGDSLQ